MINETDLKTRIINNYAALSPQGKKVAKYIVDNYFLIISLSINELACNASVSDTAVVRFAKALGFHGYLEFKNALKAEQALVRSPYESLSYFSSRPKGEFIPRYLETVQKDIKNFLGSLDYKMIDLIADKLLKADCVYLVGLGSDATVALFLNNYLPLIGIPCVMVSEEGMLLRERVFNLKPDDVVFLTSMPAMLEEERWLSRYCKKVGASLIAVTDSEITANTLNSNTFIICAESTETFFNSYVLPMLLSNILLMTINEHAPSQVKRNLKKYKDLISEE